MRFSLSQISFFLKYIALNAAKPMRIFTDQLLRPVRLESVPKKIVSLVPSQTELLYTLGLGNEVVGITKFCTHPSSWFQHKTKIGGTKNLKVELIEELQPDLIIANKEENVQEQVERLASKFPVWISDVHDLETALAMIFSIGQMVDREDQALQMLMTIKESFEDLILPEKKLRTAYLVWQNPFMTVGGDTFISDMLKRCGFINVFRDLSRYPSITNYQLQLYNCEVLFLSTEPYPFKQKHVAEIKKLLPNTRVILVDGQMFSWYGSRLLKSPSYFKLLIGKLMLGL
jgi:ABC-type Fe3+-hydroxamate transport system substrate-binding protein